MTVPQVFGSSEGTVHFMGVAGAGMIPLAELFARSGLTVSGCDLQVGPAARSILRMCSTKRMRMPRLLRA